MEHPQEPTGITTPEPLTEHSGIPSIADNVPAPQDAWSISQEKRAREATTTSGDYLGAMWRQDGWVDGALAQAVGSDMAPDPDYVPFDPVEWEGLTQGVWPEFQNAFYGASSAAHAQYLKSLLLQKQDDLVKLGDLDGLGRAGRFGAGLLFGLVDPINIPAMLATGGGTLLARSAGLAMKPSVTRGVTAGLTTAAGLNAGVEKLRQDVNFEDDSVQVLEAALFGAAFSSPFVAISARGSVRAANAAAQEQRVVGHLRDLSEGKEITPEAKVELDAYIKAVDDIEQIESGNRSVADEPRSTDTPGVVSPEFRTKVRETYERVEAERAAKKNNELNEIFAEGHMAKGRASDEMQALIDQANGPDKPMSTMELAFMRAFVKGRENKTAKAEQAAILEPATVEQRAALDAAAPLSGKQRLAAYKAASNQAATDRGPHQRETITPADDTVVGQNGSGETLYERADGSRYRMHYGKPNFGGDLSPAKPESFIGEDVFWVDDEGAGYAAGQVIRVTKQGKLVVRHADTDKIVVVAQEELHPDSPGHVTPEVEGFLPGSVGSAQVAPVDNVWDEPPAMSAGRLDYGAVFGRSNNPVIRELGFKLTKNVIANSKHYAQGWTATERKTNIIRTVGLRFHADAKAAFKDAVKVRKLSWFSQWGFHKEFYDNVTHLARGDKSVITGKNEDIAAQLTKAAAAMSRVYETMAQLATKSGVKGADRLKPGSNYVNRMWVQAKIRSAAGEHGLENVVGALSRAMRVEGFKNNPARTGSFLSAVIKLEYSHALQDIQLVARDMNTLRKELGDEKHGMTPDEIDAIVDAMFEAKGSDSNAGVAANLKHRMDIDENYSEVTASGKTIRISDFFENDARMVVDAYMNPMAGHIAAAEQGITSRADMVKRMNDATAAHDHTVTSAEAFKSEMQHMWDVYDNLTGRPMSVQTFGGLDRFMTATRGYTRSVFLGQLGIAAAFELKNALALTSMRALFRHLPTFRAVIQTMRTGRMANEELAAGIEAMTGAGLEHNASYARQNELTEFTYDRGLGEYENFANKASHAIDIMSGNRYFTALTRHLSGAMFVQQHVDFASGRKVLSESAKDRLVGQGINRDDIDWVFADLKRFTEVDSKGRVKVIRWEDWQQQAPTTYSNYSLTLSREIRDAIQDHDIGETMPFMHTTLGKIISELRTFTFVGHGKQFLKGMHYRDITTFRTWIFAFLGEALAYSMQQTANFAHNQEELDKRLSMERIAKGAMQRMAVTGIAPMILETGYAIGTGGKSLFGPGSTTNTDNRNIFITPSFMVAAKVYGAGKTLGGAVNPFSDSITSQQEMKDLFSVLPGGNLWVMRNLNDALSSTFPKSDNPNQ